jgi:pimeloyl-ACP methyl ester carboxylesterase
MLPRISIGLGSPTLIFLHYFGGSRYEWDAVIALLSYRFRCVAADAPGFGDAVDVDGYTVEEMVQHVLRLTASFAEEPCVLIGHSMMGKVSMIAASRHPENLRALVLVAPSPLEPEPMTEDARLVMVRGNESDESARTFFLKGAKSELRPEDIQRGIEDVRRANRTAWRRWPESGTREDWSAAIPPIELPTLLLVGQYDPAIPLPFQREETMSHLRHGSLEVIAGVGHLLPYEAPVEVSNRIEAFVSCLQR